MRGRGRRRMRKRRSRNGEEVEQEEEVEEVGAPGKSEVVTSPGAALGKSALEMNSR